MTQITPDISDDSDYVLPVRVIKPLYMLIKVDVDADIVYNQAKAHTYAQNHCDKLEYELVDYHYPTKYSEREHPFIKL